MKRALFVLVSLLVLIGCIQLGGQVPGQAAGQVEKEYVCADGTVVKNVSACPAVQLAEEKDPEMKTCEDMPEVEGQASFTDYCYMGLAYKRENATLCKKLSESRRAECYSSIAVLKEDSTICDSAGTQKNYCYMNYAVQKEDVDTCDKITETNTKDNCYSQYASRFGDVTVCDKIKMANNRDGCYMNIASMQCDNSTCNKIANANTKEQCLRNLEYCTGGGAARQPTPAKPA